MLNSLLEIVTFGKVAGLNASKQASLIEDFELLNQEQYHKDKEEINSIYHQKNSINFYERKEYLGNILFKDLGLFRTENNMNNLLEEINKLLNDISFMGIGDKSKEFNKNLVEFIEFKNILQVSKIATLCAIQRKESRGSHYRSDYTNTDSSFDKCTLIVKDSDSIKISFEEIL